MSDDPANPQLPENPNNSESADSPEYELPPGDHALEIAARRGLGPLSPLAAEAWHGYARPCVSCGQLVDRDASACDHCGQDISEEMLQKMVVHSGPWYVLEHVRPFPGVTLERIIRQIRRGVLNETSIVRGPETNHQWRFAVETPGLSRFFDRCWRCHGQIKQTAERCPHCGVPLGFGIRPGVRSQFLDGEPTSEEKPLYVPPATETKVPERPKTTAPTAESAPPQEELSHRSPVASKPEAPEEAQNTQVLAEETHEQTQNRVPPQELLDLSEAVRDRPAPAADMDDRPRVAGIPVTFIIILMLILMIVALWAVSGLRQRATNTASLDAPASSTPHRMALSSIFPQA